MSDARFQELLGRLLDDELSAGELSELAALAEADPQRQDELRLQLEAAELLAQAEDDLRSSSLFLAAIQMRIGEDPFVTGVRAAIRNDSGNDRLATSSMARPRRRWPWALAGVAVTAVLAVGVFLLWPKPDQTESSIARITALNGSVQWTGDGGVVVRELEVGRALSGGTLEPLAADSWAEIEFHDGSKVTVFGRSAVTIAERGQKELHLRRGGLSANVSPQPAGRPMRIHTPTADLEVLGTQLNLDAEPASTVLTVNEGRVRVTRVIDGRVAEVSADHQIVASTNRTAEFNATPRDKSTGKWRSKLPDGVVYGKWLPKDGEKRGGLRATPLLWRDCRQKEQKPIVLYVSTLSVSRGKPTVILRPGARFRVRGRMTVAADLVVGLTTKHPRGGFAGKFLTGRGAAKFPQAGGDFDFEVRAEDFKPEKPQGAQSPLGLEIHDLWCLTIHTDAGLTLQSVELIPPKQ